MKILVRLPNWLGDMVMSVGFLNQLPLFFPGAEISVIVKKSLFDLLPLFPETKHRFAFHKSEFSGINGLVKFGKQIRKAEKFDVFFCLPDSLSSAIMGAATGADQRIGYRKEFRQLLLTNVYSRPSGLHRVEEYIRLIELYTGREAVQAEVLLGHSYAKKEYVVVNINSEASSRRLTVNKAVELLDLMTRSVEQKIVLIGSPAEKEFVGSVVNRISQVSRIENCAGQTSLAELAELLASAQCMVTTDSGPAHLANALGTPTVVLFGAGKESNTAPYNKEWRNLIRLGELSCEPCLKNTCVRYAIPQCLERLDSNRIVDTLKRHLS